MLSFACNLRIGRLLVAGEKVLEVIRHHLLSRYPQCNTRTISNKIRFLYDIWYQIHRTGKRDVLE